MKIQSGDIITHTYRVKSQDLAQFESGVVHHVCSTFTLGREVEWTSRKFVLEEVNDDVEFVGTYLEIKHLSPAVEGEVLDFTALVESFDGRELISSVEVRVGKRMIAMAKTGQKMIDKADFKENILRLARNGEG